MTLYQWTRGANLSHPLDLTIRMFFSGYYQGKIFLSPFFLLLDSFCFLF
jgi:hypothetical protein